MTCDAGEVSNAGSWANVGLSGVSFNDDVIYVCLNHKEGNENNMDVGSGDTQLFFKHGGEGSLWKRGFANMPKGRAA